MNQANGKLQQSEAGCNSGERTRRAMRSAFSLTETVVATLLVGLLLVGALRSLGASIQTHHVTQQQVRAMLLGEQLLIEVASMPWSDPDAPSSAGTIGPDSGDPSNPTARQQLDDMDDFDDWTENVASAADGTPLSGSDAMGRTIAVQNLSTTDPTQTVADNVDTGIRKLTVTVHQGASVRAIVSLIVTRAAQNQANDFYQYNAIP